MPLASISVQGFRSFTDYQRPDPDDFSVFDVYRNWTTNGTICENLLSHMSPPFLEFKLRPKDKSGQPISTVLVKNYFFLDNSISPRFTSFSVLTEAICPAVVSVFLYAYGILTYIQSFKPEVTEIVRLGGELLGCLGTFQGNRYVLQTFVFFRVINSPGDKPLGYADVIYPGLGLLFRYNMSALAICSLRSSSSPKVKAPVGQESTHLGSFQPLSRRWAQKVHFWAMFKSQLK